MIALEEKTAAEAPSILELSREGLHDRRFPSACGAIQLKHDGSWIRIHRPFAQIIEHFCARVGMTFGLWEAICRVMNGLPRDNTVQYINACINRSEGDLQWKHVTHLDRRADEYSGV